MGNTGTPNVERHRGAFIAGLRELADMLERFEDLPVPFPAGDLAHVRVHLRGGDARDRFVAAARVLPARPAVTTGAALITHRFGAPHDPALGLVYAVHVSPSVLADAPTPEEIAGRAEAFVAGVTGVPA